MTKKIECFLDEEGQYLAGKSTILIKNNDINLLRFVLALLNSKLLTFIYKNNFKSLALSGGYMRLGAPQIKELPILFDKEKSLKISKETYKMIELNKKFQKLDSFIDEDEYKETKRKIEKINKEINEMVYSLYDLTQEQVKLVEKP